MSTDSSQAVPAEESGERIGFFSDLRLRQLAIAVVFVYGATLAIRAVQYFWLGAAAGSAYCRDFTWIWLSGKLAASASPVAVYDHALLTAARAALLGLVPCPLEHFDYPPLILFFTAPLGFLPYIPAYVVWIGATIALYLVAQRAILPGPTAALKPFPL